MFWRVKEPSELWKPSLLQAEISPLALACLRHLWWRWHTRACQRGAACMCKAAVLWSKFAGDIFECEEWALIPPMKHRSTSCLQGFWKLQPRLRFSRYAISAVPLGALARVKPGYQAQWRPVKMNKKQLDTTGWFGKFYVPINLVWLCSMRFFFLLATCLQMFGIWWFGRSPQICVMSKDRLETCGFGDWLFGQCIHLELRFLKIKQFLSLFDCILLISFQVLRTWVVSCLQFSMFSVKLQGIRCVKT